MDTVRCNANDRRVSRNLFVRRVSRVSREVSKDYPYCVNSIRVNKYGKKQRLRQGDISPDRDNSSPLFAQSLYVMYYDCIVVYCDCQNASVRSNDEVIQRCRRSLEKNSELRQVLSFFFPLEMQIEWKPSVIYHLIRRHLPWEIEKGIYFFYILILLPLVISFFSLIGFTKYAILV